MIQANRIYIGAVSEDSSGYPDCRPEFYAAFQRVIDVGTKPETALEIRTPIIAMKKREIVLRGQALGAPIELTWSCYQESERACGACDSCALRLRGFREAGVTDRSTPASAAMRAARGDTMSRPEDVASGFAE